MAQFPGITLTNAGLNMIAESQATSTALIFTSLKMGDGTLATGEDIKLLTAVKNPILTAAINSYTNQGDGQIKLRFTISNGALTSGFFAREIGIYAKVGTGGTEQLYAYTNAGNLTDYIPDKNTPIDEQIIDIYLVVGNASSVQIVTDSSIMYVTTTDLNEHKASATAHAEAISAHNTSETAHDDIRTLAEKSGMPLGTILPWLVTAVPAGWLALDTGALVSRATYPELWAWVQANAPLISESAWQTQASTQSSVGAFSTGDGSTTFRLPRIVDYVRGGILADAGTWQGDSIVAHDHSEYTLGANGSGTVKGADASYSTPISATPTGTNRTGYTGSTETRPKTIKMVYCVKAFDATTNQGLIDITELANEMIHKADADLNNVNSNLDFITSSWESSDGSSWYVKYKSGLTEQGVTLSGATAGNFPVTFPVAFTKTSYFHKVGAENSATGWNLNVNVNTKTISGCNVYLGNPLASGVIKLTFRGR